MFIRSPELILSLVLLLISSTFFSCGRKPVTIIHPVQYDGKYDGKYCGTTWNEHNYLDHSAGGYVTLKDTFDLCQDFKYDPMNRTFQLDSSLIYFGSWINIYNLPDTIMASWNTSLRSYNKVFLIPKENKIVHLQGYSYMSTFWHDSSVLIKQ